MFRNWFFFRLLSASSISTHCPILDASASPSHRRWVGVGSAGAWAFSLIDSDYKWRLFYATLAWTLSCFRLKSQLIHDFATRSTLQLSLPLGAVPDKVSVVERRLFHGLPGGWPNVVRIARQNVDPRSDERRPTPYGLGVGFSVSAGRGSLFGHSMTQRDIANGLRYVVLARVLVGRSTRGLPFMKGPSLHGDPLYNSTVNDMTNPTEYVLFDRRHIYPEYVIAYDDLKTASRASCVIL